MHETKHKIVEEKNRDRGPIRVSDETHRWLKNEQHRIYIATDKTPSFAEIIDELVRRVSKRPIAVASNERGR